MSNNQLTLDIYEKKRVLISLKPKYYNLIINGIKDYEYRSRFPDESVMAYIYVTKPIGEICAYIEFGKPISDYDSLIGTTGYGLEDFIEGKKENKKAIPIIKIYPLRQTVSLDCMRCYGVYAPQSYSYIDPESSFAKMLDALIIKS